MYVDDILLSGDGEEQRLAIIEQPKEWFETVDLGDARFLQGMGIRRKVNAGTILFTKEAYESDSTVKTEGVALWFTTFPARMVGHTACLSTGEV